MTEQELLQLTERELLDEIEAHHRRIEAKLDQLLLKFQETKRLLTEQDHNDTSVLTNSKTD